VSFPPKSSTGILICLLDVTLADAWGDLGGDSDWVFE
jgi:hypothetical protein